MPLRGWQHVSFLYTDDLGRNCMLRFNDYLGDAGGLSRTAPEGLRVGPASAHLKPRRVRFRGLKPDPRTGRKPYREVPVQVTSPLWQGPLGQVIVIHDDEYESIARMPEKEYGRKKMLAEIKGRV